MAEPARVLTEWYQKLTTCLEAVSARKLSLEEREDRLCAVILEDDLAELLIECESLLLAASAVTPEELYSFHSRSETVLEEVVELLNVQRTPSIVRML